MTISTIPCCRARLMIPKSNGPAKNSGKMVSKSRRIIGGWWLVVGGWLAVITTNHQPLTTSLQFQQPFRRIDHDPFPLGRDLDAYTQDERDQKFARAAPDHEQRRGAVIPHLFDATEAPTFNGDYLAADQVEIVVCVFGQFDQLIARNQHARVSQLFGAGDCVAAGEFQRDAAFMHARVFEVEEEEPSVGAFDINSA